MRIHLVRQISGTKIHTKRVITVLYFLLDFKAFYIYRYETTATSLAFTAYLIATHPEVQEKLIEEIDQEFGPDLEV